MCEKHVARDETSWNNHNNYKSGRPTVRRQVTNYNNTINEYVYSP